MEPIFRKPCRFDNFKSLYKILFEKSLSLQANCDATSKSEVSDYKSRLVMVE